VPTPHTRCCLSGLQQHMHVFICAAGCGLSSSCLLAYLLAHLHGSTKQSAQGSKHSSSSRSLKLLLTQRVLSCVLQAAVEDEYVEAEAHNPSSSSSSKSSSKADGGKGGGRKWWGQMGAAAKAALSSAKGSSTSPSPSGKSPSSSSSSSRSAAARTAGGEAAAAQQKARQERVHQMVSSALDVLLRLTPPPPGTDSCLKSLARPDVAAMRSLALPLMVAGDAVTALSGCLWSSWTDVSLKAVSGLKVGRGVCWEGEWCAGQWMPECGCGV
jgi:hypothetical protein